MKKESAHQNTESKDIAFFLFLITPEMTTKKLFEIWLVHPVLKDYERPEYKWLEVWVEEFSSERNSILYKDDYIRT